MQKYKTQKLNIHQFDDEAWHVGQEEDEEDHGEHLQKSLEKHRFCKTFDHQKNTKVQKFTLSSRRSSAFVTLRRTSWFCRDLIFKLTVMYRLLSRRW